MATDKQTIFAFDLIRRLSMEDATEVIGTMLELVKQEQATLKMKE